MNSFWETEDGKQVDVATTLIRIKDTRTGKAEVVDALTLKHIRWIKNPLRVRKEKVK